VNWSAFKAMSNNATWRRQLWLSWKKRDRAAPDRGGETLLSSPEMLTHLSRLLARSLADAPCAFRTTGCGTALVLGRDEKLCIPREQHPQNRSLVSSCVALERLDYCAV
jgi:hypothetical protein